MRRIITAAAVVAALSGAAMAAEKTYQVTGPVLELRDNAIVVEKGKEKWEIAKDAQTKVKGDLKKGSKVTVQYVMQARSIDVKGDVKGDAKKK